MKFFSYALAYAVIVFLIYNLFRFFRFAFVRIKAFVIRRKLSKKAELTDVDDVDTEKNDD